MLIVELTPLPNGAHRNQTCGEMPVPEGWAEVPESVGTAETLENFPFGEIAVEDVGGVPTVTGWTPLPVPAVEGAGPTEEEDTAALLVDHEFRLTLLELGVEGGER